MTIDIDDEGIQSVLQDYQNNVIAANMARVSASERVNQEAQTKKAVEIASSNAFEQTYVDEYEGTSATIST